MIRQHPPRHHPPPATPPPTTHHSLLLHLSLTSHPRPFHCSQLTALTAHRTHPRPPPPVCFTPSHLVSELSERLGGIRPRPPSGCGLHSNQTARRRVNPNRGPPPKAMDPARSLRIRDPLPSPGGGSRIGGSCGIDQIPLAPDPIQELSSLAACADRAQSGEGGSEGQRPLRLPLRLRRRAGSMWEGGQIPTDRRSSPQGRGIPKGGIPRPPNSPQPQKRPQQQIPTTSNPHDPQFPRPPIPTTSESAWVRSRIGHLKLCDEGCVLPFHLVEVDV